MGFGDGLVVDHSLHLAGNEGSHGVGGGGEGHVLGLGQVLGDPGLTGGAGLSGDGDGCVVEGGLVGVSALHDDDGLVGVVVAVREVDQLGALVGDGDGAHGAVHGVAGVDLRHQAVEVLRVEVVELEAQALCDLLHHGDVEAVGLAVNQRLHGRVVQVAADGELAVLDEGVGAGVKAAAGRGSLAALVRRPAAAGKAQAAHQGACQQARSHDLCKFLHDSSPLFIISE